MKKCFKCGVIKPIGEFYKHPQMADGHLGKCKDCTRNDVKNNRSERYDYYKTFDKMRANLPHRMAARKAYATTGRGRLASAKSRKNYRERYPEKYAAHEAVTIAVASGKLIKPDTCSSCGNLARVQGHHEDYSKPLDVIWLCPACHALRHRARDTQPAMAF